MAGSLEWARLLYQQGRHDEAIDVLGAYLADAPGDAQAVSWLALCRVAKKELAVAEATARHAIELDPNSPFPHFVLATILSARARRKDAIRSIEHAIGLAPRVAHYHGLHGVYLLHAGRQKEALEAADRGLALDPESSICLNARASALAALGRSDLASATLHAALGNDPEDPYTHTNRGWLALERREYEPALHHFSEALRRDPSLDWARAGLVEALKAKNAVYRPLLAYTLWMSRMPARNRIGIVVGAYLAAQMLVRLMEQQRTLAEYSWVVKIGYASLVLLTWLVHPFFNLLLATNRFGRQALTPAERATAYAIGVCLLAAILGAILGTIFSSFGPFIGLIFLALAIPASSAGKCAPGWPRRVMIAVTIGLLLLGTAGILCDAGVLGKRFEGLGVWCVLISIGGALLSTLFGNLLAHVRPNK